MVAPQPTAPLHDNDTFETWIAALTKLAEQHEREARDRRSRVVTEAHADSSGAQLRNPLPKLAEGPYRSLGGYFDYTHWAGRERFLELDKAISASQDLREPEVDCGPEML